MIITRKSSYLFLIIVTLVLLAFSGKKEEVKYMSPVDFEIDAENELVYVAMLTTKQVSCFEIKSGLLKKELNLKYEPKALTLANEKLYVATSFSEGKLVVINPERMKVEATIEVGHGASDVVISSDGTKAYVANGFSDDISVVDLKSKKESKRIKVLRQPMTITLSKDGKYLFVANFLTAHRADVDTVTAEVSIIDTEQLEVIKNIPLANGSNALRGMTLSDDGKYVFVSHNLGRFQVPTTQLEQGWMNTSALSVIDAANLEYVATVLLDEPERGAAGSWGVACTPDNILVAHSGTHDFSVIDYAGFVEKLMEVKEKAMLSYDLRFLSGLRSRIVVSGNGPRIIKGRQNEVYVANYFSDQIDIIDLDDPQPSRYKSINLNPDLQIDSTRLGEIYFNDATYCFQAWQSCNGCHPNHARTDGLNWDLMNDGIGNPKNCKSLLYAHETPPAMITGLRANAELAVRAGFRHIQFAQIEESHARAVDFYLKSLRPVPSPKLVNGKLSDLAKHGKMVFEKMNCAICHPAPFYTDLKKHKIGKASSYDKQNEWDTPTLAEVWRTGPYLHDGRCASVKEVLQREKHGVWNEISDEELDALVEYVLSL